MVSAECALQHWKAYEARKRLVYEPRALSSESLRYNRALPRTMPRTPLAACGVAVAAKALLIHGHVHCTFDDVVLAVADIFYLDGHTARILFAVTGT